MRASRRDPTASDAVDLPGHARERPCCVAGPREGFVEIDSTSVDTPGPVGPRPSQYADEAERQASAPPSDMVVFRPRTVKLDRARSVIRMPSFEAVEKDPVLDAHASRRRRRPAQDHVSQSGNRANERHRSVQRSSRASMSATGAPFAKGTRRWAPLTRRSGKGHDAGRHWRVVRERDTSMGAIATPPQLRSASMSAIGGLPTSTPSRPRPPVRRAALRPRATSSDITGSSRTARGSARS
jgi:hypothetical protein